STLTVDDHKSAFDVQVTPRLESRLASGLGPRLGHHAARRAPTPTKSARLQPRRRTGEPQS
ncbi:hypothetical protein, partial [Pseudoclavibacter sp. VKM Ac-2867]|uniref:hypothetical protein n=1 Tax=Pseudoclavibacter sp. VKM Ac-2867 TaxID=2783829 RepID=UPI001E4E69D7